MRVVDLTHYIAGPFCTKLLAGFGVEVIKVERPEGGDPARRYGPFPGDIPHIEKSGLFLHLNSDKKSVTLNLKSSFGHQVVKDLVRAADILVENFRPGVMERLGLSYPELKALNPRIIMTSISNFGQTGPYRNFKASELTLFAMGGPMVTTGLPDRYPLKHGGNLAQYQAGNLAALATMAAWYGLQRGNTPGQYVDISIMETGLQSINGRVVELLGWEYRGKRQARTNLATVGFPTGFYPCSDGYIHVHGATFRFPKLCKMIGRPDLADNPRYASSSAQNDPRAKEEFEAEVWLPWTLERTKAEITEDCQKYGVLGGALNEVSDVVALPQLKARGFFIEEEHPVAGPVSVPGAPFRVCPSPWEIHRPAPTLGQHNEEILCDRLGYSRQDLAQMAAMSLV